MAGPTLVPAAEAAQARPAAANGKAARRARHRARQRAGWLFVAPALAAYAIFVLWPMGLTVQYSLYEWNGIGASTWVGFDNYTRVFTDPELFDTILHALELILYFCLVPVALGLAIANTIRRIATTRLALVARTIIFVPQIIPLVAAGITWSWLLPPTAWSTRCCPRPASAASRAPGWATSAPRCPRWASSARGSCSACARCCCSPG